MRKIILTLVLLVSAFSSVGIVAFANNETITPYYANTQKVDTQFTISEDGTGLVVLKYTGEAGITTDATIKTKIQKRFLFFFWNDVDIGVENNTWVDECVGHTYFGTHSVNLGSGTYKAIVEYTIRGTGGEPDVITQEIERSH